MRATRSIVLGSILLPGIFLSGARSTFATCGSANCFLVTGTQEGVSAAGILTVDASYRFIPQGRKLSGTKEVSDVLTPKVDFENGLLLPDHHREIRTQNTLVEVDLSYGVTPRLTLSGSLPIINQRDHEHFDDADDPLLEHFTKEDGASGFGDVRLGARYAFLVKGASLLVGGLALKLPTGAYTLRDGEGNINEPTIQPGTGSVDMIASVHYARHPARSRVESFLSGSYRANRENDLDYEFGDETIFDAGMSRRAGERLTWSLQLDWRRSGRDRFLSQPVPSTGANFLNLTPGVRLDTGTGTVLYAFVQVPVRQEVNEAQLAPWSGLLLGVSKSF